jgi:hypothetical protein
LKDTKNEGNVDIHYRKPVAYKVKKEYVKFLVDEINKNKTITLHELNQKLKDKYIELKKKILLINKLWQIIMLIKFI